VIKRAKGIGGEAVGRAHANPFFAPKAYKSMMCNEVNHLCHLYVLCRCNESKLVTPSFGTPKKNGQI
jgi:hypothetical protein